MRRPSLSLSSAADRCTPLSVAAIDVWGEEDVGDDVSAVPLSEVLSPRVINVCARQVSAQRCLPEHRSTLDLHLSASLAGG